MKVRIIKIFVFFLVSALFISILWRQTHLPYQAVYEPPAELEFEEAFDEEKMNKESSAEFPTRVEREVSDVFSYNADITVGKDFDRNQFYQCTAVLRKPDPQQWMDFFQVDSESWNISEAEDGNTRDRKIGTQVNCVKGNEETLYIGKNFVLYNVHNMHYTNLSQNFAKNEYVLPADQTFSKDSDLPFESREENWKNISRSLSELDLLIDDCIIISEYSLDLESLQKQEEILFQAGLKREDEKNPFWSTADEGYYYILIQGYQGLPVFCHRTTAGLSEENELSKSSLNLYYTDAGFRMIDLRYWFDFQKTDQKITLAPFEKIMETIDQKYANVKQEQKLEVTECRLMLYPNDTGKKEMEVIPIWLCTIERGLSRPIYLSIHAVTAEEVYEMEYFTGIW